MAIDITGTKSEVSVGEKVTLGVRYTKEWGVLKSVEWSIPGKFVKNYTASFAKGEVVPVPASDLKAFVVSFYWVDGGDGRKVEAKCVFTSEGKDVNKTISTTCDVKRPKMDSFTSKTGSVLVQADRIGFAGPGITWTAKASPNGSAAGEIAFLQLINPHRVYSPGKKWTSGGVFVLDGAVGKTKIFYAQQTVPISGAAATLSSNDSPGSGLNIFDALQYSGEDHFRIRVMYKSNAVDSIWVPLGMLDWDWKGQAKRASLTDAWALDGAPAFTVDPSGGDNLEFPEWTRYFPNLGWSP
jgi:hypothetical protein